MTITRVHCKLLYFSWRNACCKHPTMKCRRFKNRRWRRCLLRMMLIFLYPNCYHYAPKPVLIALLAGLGAPTLEKQSTNIAKYSIFVWHHQKISKNGGPSTTRSNKRIKQEGYMYSSFILSLLCLAIGLPALATECWKLSYSKVSALHQTCCKKNTDNNKFKFTSCFAIFYRRYVPFVLMKFIIHFFVVNP